MFPVIFFPYCAMAFQHQKQRVTMETQKQQKSFTFTSAILPGKVTNGPESNFLLYYRHLYTRFSPPPFPDELNMPFHNASDNGTNFSP